MPSSEPDATGADIVVRTLEMRGTTHVFGIPGAKIDKVFDRLADSSIETVVCRHEQNAAFMAGAVGRMTGRAGVALVTSGPGVSNLTTGLVTANSEGDPVVALGGAVAAADATKQVHQSLDSVALMTPVTKYAGATNTPHAVAEVLSNAFRAAEGGRPGAAFVSLPMDVMTAAAGANVLALPPPLRLGAAAAEAVSDAAKLIRTAQNPVVLVGLSASKPVNAAAVRSFIEDNNLAVVGTFQSAGAIGAHLMGNFGGRVGQIANQPADTLLESADLVLTIGYDPVEYWPSLWNAGKSRSIVHIDVQMADIDADYVPTVELIGDVPSTLAALSPQVNRSSRAPVSDRILQAITAERDDLATRSAGYSGTPIHPLRLIFELQKLVDTDMTLCLDMGSFYLWLARHLYSFRARQLLMTNGQQTLGVALPWAIAATIVRPQEKVISISGDGGFLFSAMELETAVRLKSPLVHLVWIDGTYDMVGTQEQLKYGRTSGVDFGPVDPVRYAEAFGATGMMINTPDDIAPTLKKALDIEGPVIIGVHVDYRDNHGLFEMVHQDSLQ